MVAWTLVLEVQFYAVAGLIEPLARPSQRQALIPWLLWPWGFGRASSGCVDPAGRLGTRVLPISVSAGVQPFRPSGLGAYAFAIVRLLLFGL